MWSTVFSGVGRPARPAAHYALARSAGNERERAAHLFVSIPAAGAFGSDIVAKPVQVCAETSMSAQNLGEIEVCVCVCVFQPTRPQKRD